MSGRESTDLLKLCLNILNASARDEFISEIGRAEHFVEEEPKPVGLVIVDIDENETTIGQ